MADTEIDSFLTKFKYVCSEGINASLNITSSNGKAIVTLHAEIGAIGAPKSPKTPLKHRSPAYYRRIARRQAMRQTVDENHSVEAGEASTEFGTVIVNETAKPVMEDDAAETL